MFGLRMVSVKDVKKERSRFGPDHPCDAGTSPFPPVSASAGARAWPEAWLRAPLRGTRLPMRAYAGTVDQRGLRWFLPEEVIPRDLLRHSVGAGLTRSTTAVWALVADEDAEAIRADLSAGRHRDACNLLLNRAVELLSLTSGVPDLAAWART